MVMSALSAPVHARSLMDAVLRRKSKFVVTPKGESASPDTLFGTFRIHWFFILVFAGSLAAGFVLGHSHPAMITWASFALLITASPIFAWRYGLRQAKKQPPVPLYEEPQDSAAPAAAYQPKPLPGQHAPQSPHGSGQKPSWAASGGGSGAGGDQTMQIALGGFGGRKE
jgi:hypothetical protein